MTEYLISFDEGAMTFPDEDLPDVARAAHEVVESQRTAKIAVSCRCAQEVRELMSDPTV